MTTKPTPPKVVDPVYGNAPDVPPGATITRKQIAEDLPRVFGKADARSKDAANWLSSEIERKQAADWASSAHVTIAGYEPVINDALTQYSRAGAAKADPDLHDLIERHGRRMRLDPHVVAKVHEAIGEKLGKRQIRRVLLDRGVITPRPKK